MSRHLVWMLGVLALSLYGTLGLAQPKTSAASARQTQEPPQVTYRCGSTEAKEEVSVVVTPQTVDPQHVCLKPGGTLKLSLNGECANATFTVEENGTKPFVDDDTWPQALPTSSSTPASLVLRNDSSLSGTKYTIKYDIGICARTAGNTPDGGQSSQKPKLGDPMEGTLEVATSTGNPEGPPKKKPTQ